MVHLPDRHTHSLLLRLTIYSLHCLQVGFYDRVRTGELTNRLSEDTRMIKTVATSSIASALRSAALCSLGLVMM